jgi:type II secretory pathway predicted ATPase ExeA
MAVLFESFYNFKRVPFSRDIPTSDLYKSTELEETLGRLEYAAERRWFAVITGDCGTGKTTTIRCYAQTLNRRNLKYSTFQIPSLRHGIFTRDS